MTEVYLIVGLGSIGKRHIRCLKKIRPNSKIVVWRQKSKETEEFDGIDKIVFSLEDALAVRPNAAIVANPATFHIQTALQLVKNNIHVLIEKPISHSLDGVDELIELSEQNNIVLMIAYVLRFRKTLIKLKTLVDLGKIGRVISVRAEVGQYLPDWRPDKDYKNCVSARQDLGGGALLELSHEIDYINWIFGDISSVYGSVKNSEVLDIDVEDTAEIIFETTTKVCGSIHLDMLQRVPSRRCKIVGSEGTIDCDLIENKVRYYDVKEASWCDYYEDSQFSADDMYVTQLESFLSSVDGGGRPVVSSSDGKQVLKIVEAIRQSSATNAKVEIN